MGMLAKGSSVCEPQPAGVNIESSIRLAGQRETGPFFLRRDDHVRVRPVTERIASVPAATDNPAPSRGEPSAASLSSDRPFFLHPAVRRGKTQ